MSLLRHLLPLDLQLMLGYKPFVRHLPIVYHLGAYLHPLAVTIILVLTYAVK